MFLEILQNSQENAYNFIRKNTLAQVFPCEFWEISNNTFFKKHLWWLLLKSKEFSNLGMELQVKRTFKSHIFLSPKKQCNSRQLAWNFLHLVIQVRNRYLNALFQNEHSFIMLLLLFTSISQSPGYDQQNGKPQWRWLPHSPK